MCFASACAVTRDMCCHDAMERSMEFLRHLAHQNSLHTEFAFSLS